VHSTVATPILHELVRNIFHFTLQFEFCTGKFLVPLQCNNQPLIVKLKVHWVHQSIIAPLPLPMGLFVGFDSLLNSAYNIIFKSMGATWQPHLLQHYITYSLASTQLLSNLLHLSLSQGKKIVNHNDDNCNMLAHFLHMLHRTGRFAPKDCYILCGWEHCKSKSSGDGS